MKVLVACEFSGIVREAFRAAGHDAWSCDLNPTEIPGQHVIYDVRDMLYKSWDLMICHPPCTYLCSSGLHWNSRTPGREEKTQAALKFVELLLDCEIPRIALENPIGCIPTRLKRPYSQIIQPHQFGEDASKATCLWLKNLPLLQPTKFVEPRIVIDASGKPKKRWANQTDSGQNKLAPSEHRSDDRSRTYKGIAAAMAAQWGGIPT